MTEMFNQRLADVIRRPLITEKATKALDINQYTFEVDPRAAKPDIKAAIEQLFDVKVIGISTMNPPRRSRRVGRFSGKRAQIKKAVVRLAEGNSIKLFPDSES
ncbi:50S ribosomal protein L23 [Prochlorococcus marinus]|uniref:50S ribosomal protein L23 n=1 Tax=Prochlorococcus marinus TaxID=1219 RepID=UPI0022B2DD4D|nr:50S ribosomal protein L23 [Prochlorococcus marinus]